MTTTKKQGFPAIIDDNSRILILGTMPGQESLKRQEYYANPRNQFWKIIGSIYSFDPELEYKERLNLLQQHHLALWDVLESGQRKGSLDQAIQDPQPNDFTELLGRYSQLRLIAFNGQPAARLFERNVRQKQTLPQLATIKQIVLPSTSSAAAIALGTKINKWRQIAQSN